jgi:hypothetical protein
MKDIFTSPTTMSDTLVNGLKIVGVATAASIGEQLTSSQFFVKVKSWNVSGTNSSITIL